VSSSVAQLLQFVQREERKLTESTIDFVQHFSGVIFFYSDFHPCPLACDFLKIIKKLFHLEMEERQIYFFTFILNRCQGNKVQIGRVRDLKSQTKYTALNRFRILSRVGVSYWMIGFIVSYTFTQLGITGNCSAIAILHTFQFIVTHAVLTSRVLATDL
jgi:hypothetical protein